MTKEEAISILKDRSCVDCAMMCAYPLERPEGDCEYADAIRMAIEALEERKTGKWIFKNDLKQFFCDKCAEPSLTYDDIYIYSMELPKFCPNCGSYNGGDEQ